MNSQILGAPGVVVSEMGALPLHLVMQPAEERMHPRQVSCVQLDKWRVTWRSKQALLKSRRVSHWIFCTHKIESIAEFVVGLWVLSFFYFSAFWYAVFSFSHAILVQRNEASAHDGAWCQFVSPWEACSWYASGMSTHCHAQAEHWSCCCTCSESY